MTSTIENIIAFIRKEDSSDESLNNARDYLKSIQIVEYRRDDGTRQEFGICYSCNHPSRLFTAHHTAAEKFCLTCVNNRISWQVVEIGTATPYYRIRDIDMKELVDVLINEQIKGISQTPRETCGFCNHVILEGAGAPARYTGITAVREGEDSEELRVHNNCAFTCHSVNSAACGGTFVRNPNGNRGHSVYGNEQLCEQCFEVLINDTDGSTCQECSSWFPDDLLHYSDYHDRYFCVICYDNLYYQCEDCGDEYQGGHTCRSSLDSRIHDYGHKPRPQFFGEAPYHFGIELEVEQMDEDSVSEGVDIVLSDTDRARRIYLKEDGSLTNGFEIVTHPHSLAEFQTVMNWDFLPELSNANYRSWDTSTCGLHIHISRTAFDNDNHLIRFTKLIYDNKNAVQTLAGRTSDYARFNDSIKSNGVGLIRKIKNGQSTDGHVAAVNADTYDSQTVEVRVFRGSLRKERVLAGIEFCHAVVEHTRNMKIVPKERPLSWTKFLSFVATNSVRYPNLNLVVDQVLNVYRQPTTAERKENG